MREKRYRCFIQLYRFFLVYLTIVCASLRKGENVLKIEKFSCF